MGQLTSRTPIPVASTNHYGLCKQRPAPLLGKIKLAEFSAGEGGAGFAGTGLEMPVSAAAKKLEGSQAPLVRLLQGGRSRKPAISNPATNRKDCWEV